VKLQFNPISNQIRKKKLVDTSEQDSFTNIQISDFFEKVPTDPWITLSLLTEKV
jgi:hypothetical protein